MVNQKTDKYTVNSTQRLSYLENNKTKFGNNLTFVDSFNYMKKNHNYEIKTMRWHFT